MAGINAKALQQLKDLSSYPLPQLEKLAANLVIRQYKKDKIIFDQGEETKLVYLLLSGVVKFSYLNSHEKQTIVSLHPAGEFFGLDSLIPKMCHPFRCEAFENCTVGTITPQTLSWRSPMNLSFGGTPRQWMPGEKSTSIALRALDLTFVNVLLSN
jgi:CRP-like cAMP-binding protein